MEVVKQSRGTILTAVISMILIPVISTILLISNMYIVNLLIILEMIIIITLIVKIKNIRILLE